MERGGSVRFFLITVWLFLSAQASAQDLDLYQSTVKFNQEITRTTGEMNQVHLEFMSLVQSLEMTPDDDSRAGRTFEVVSRAPASVSDDDALANDVQVLLIPKYQRSPLHN